MAVAKKKTVKKRSAAERSAAAKASWRKRRKLAKAEETQTGQTQVVHGQTNNEEIAPEKTSEVVRMTREQWLDQDAEYKAYIDAKMQAKGQASDIQSNGANLTAVQRPAIFDTMFTLQGRVEAYKNQLGRLTGALSRINGARGFKAPAEPELNGEGGILSNLNSLIDYFDDLNTDFSAMLDSLEATV